MNISFRPGGLCPSAYNIDKAYADIAEESTVMIDSVELLYRIMIGIHDGEVPYGSTVLSIYDDNGFKHETKFSNTGQPYNTEVFRIWPLSRLPRARMTLTDPLAKYSDRTIETCGNCDWSKSEMCQLEESKLFSQFVSDYEPACDKFSDAHKSWLQDKKETNE